MTRRIGTANQETAMTPTVQPVPLPLSPEEAQRQAVLAGTQRAVEIQKAKEAREAAAAGPGTVTLIAIADFTIEGEPDYPDGRVVHAGDEFTVTKADLPRYAGRGMPKA
jgi:hypothetical protein